MIFDLAMPVMNGLEAARRISDFAPEVTIILFTMHESAMVWKAARAGGIRDVLSKSEDGNQQLLDSLRGLLDKSGIHYDERNSDGSTIPRDCAPPLPTTKPGQDFPTILGTRNN